MKLCSQRVGLRFRWLSCRNDVKKCCNAIRIVVGKVQAQFTFFIGPERRNEAERKPAFV